MPLSEAIGKDITTIEGLAKHGVIHKVRQAWIANDVPQCGDCQSGMIMSLAALLRSIPNPTDADIDLAIPTSTVAAHSRRYVQPFTLPRTLEGSIMTHVPFVNCCSFVIGAVAVGYANCHDDNWDKRLAGSAITQGHPTGYPVYRLERQGLGSLQRRLRNCMVGMRAQPFNTDLPETVALELFLMSRARGMLVETPVVRP